MKARDYIAGKRRGKRRGYSAKRRRLAEGAERIAQQLADQPPARRNRRCFKRAAVKWLKCILVAWRWLTEDTGRPLPRGFPHYVPPHNSVDSFTAGAERCFYCLAREGTLEFAKPCPRRRPVELP